MIGDSKKKQVVFNNARIRQVSH